MASSLMSRKVSNLSNQRFHCTATLAASSCVLKGGIRDSKLAVDMLVAIHILYLNSYVRFIRHKQATARLLITPYCIPLFNTPLQVHLPKKTLFSSFILLFHLTFSCLVLPSPFFLLLLHSSSFLSSFDLFYLCL